MEGFCMTARLIGPDAPPAEIVQAAMMLMEAYSRSL